jgi:dissimilatory sulfite reductase (desulfoviridin) alpha/beta subunit
MAISVWEIHYSIGSLGGKPMEWTQEAMKAISRVPFFVRKRVKKRVEEEASREGSSVVTLDHVRACQRRFLERMEDEVKGFRIETCFGPSGCPNRVLESDDLVRGLEGLLNGKDLRSFLLEKVGPNLKLHHEFRISLSDCPNACSRPQIADIGLIGCRRPKVGSKPCDGCQMCVLQCEENAIRVEGQLPVVEERKCLGCGKCIDICPTGALEEAKRGYRVLVGGKLGRHPRLATELPGVHAKEQVLEMVDRIVQFYLKNSTKGERLGEIVERKGESAFFEELGP